MSQSLTQRLVQAAQQEMARTLADLCSEIGAAESSIMLPEGDKDLVFFASTNPSLLQPGAPKTPINASYSGIAYRTGQTMAVADAADQARHFKAVDELVKYRTHEFAAIPLTDRAILGVLTLVNRADGAGGTRPFSLPELRRAEAVAAEVANALARFPGVRAGERREDDPIHAFDAEFVSDLERLREPERRVARSLVRALLQNRAS